MSSDSITEIFFAVFFMHLENLHSKEVVTATKCLKIQIRLFFFLGCYKVTSSKKRRYRNKRGHIILPYALMMKELELFDSRITILHQNDRSLAGQHLLLKELIQDNGYNCLYAFSETWLSKNYPEEFWQVDKQNVDCF